eukprot:TRINITY_DN2120_c0_g1_i1.p1 TRINITY_DN2120_c0_g1~~TRINITY_DN2120_c0_g1_i1.p1  ORF type:complete len:249 (-),score=54.76 TRINITY_DN2120_c0_g1_i1:118-864(-)
MLSSFFRASCGPCSTSFLPLSRRIATSALQRRVGVVLSGCGVFDGSEIQEAVLTLLALDKRGANVKCFAPNTEQYHVIDHRNGEEMNEKRNVIVESARISRGIVGDLDTFRACDFDALIFPGGFGAAKNLSSFAFDGTKATVHPSVLRAVREMHATHKPMGFVCITPASIAAVCLGSSSPRLTIGNDANVAAAINTLGGEHVQCDQEQCVVDGRNILVSTPAYMLPGSIATVATGIEKLVDSVLGLIQ